MIRSFWPFVAAAVVCGPLSAAPVPKVKAVVLMPVAIGTKWEYIRNGDEKRVYIEEVTESASKDGVATVKVDITTDTGAKQFEKYVLRDGEMRLVESSSHAYDPPMVLRKTRMKEGDTWACKRPYPGANWEMTFTVGKAEKVTVPAGEFTAVPIRRTYDTNPDADIVYWFADGVGLVKQTTNGNPVQELKTFKLGKGEK